MKNNYFSLFILLGIFLAITSLFMFLVPGIPNSYIFLKIRFSKGLSLFLVGSLTGIGSYITQLLTKNKKADVSTLGVGAFNILATVLIVVFFSAQVLIIGKNDIFIAIIFTASFLASIFLWFMTKFLFRDSNNLLIMGIILTLFASALGYIIIDRLKVHDQQEVANYLIGSILINKQMFNIQNLIGIITVIISAIWLFIFGDRFIISVDNENKAKTLGIKTNLHKIMGIFFIAITSASAFVIAGNIIFIGFAIGNVNYLIFKKNLKFSSIGVILIGGIITLLAYYIFERIFGYKTYAGIYIIIISGFILIITTILERYLKWKKIK